MKPYDVGFICGRFQTFHKGHEKLVETAKLLCDRVLIFIGSAQECGTERNPFNINTRTKMLREVYGYDNNIMIYALSDMTNENDITPEWGKYLIQHIKRYIHKSPELMIYGNDDSRSGWFDLPISGTQLRNLMIKDKREEWMKLVCPKSKEDITDEAQQQCNCLAGYVERYINGQSNIFFMRKYKDKETSYITIETGDEHELRQIYYAHNRVVSEHDRRIAERWCEKCKKIDAGKLGPNGVSLKADENNKNKKEEAAS